jgi:glutathione peroxidase-family protein
MWNFGKYLVGPDGQLLTYWKSQVKPEDTKITQAIESALTHA